MSSLDALLHDLYRDPILEVGYRNAMLLLERLKYYVVLHEGAWKISFGGKRTSAYPTQQSAIDEAVSAAHEAYRKGWDAQVLVQSGNGLFREERTYGHDPFPPLG